MNEEKLKIILDHQTKLILNVIISLEYLKTFPKYLEHIGQSKPKSLWFIYNSIRNNTIINLTQLFHSKEHYSFSEVRKYLKEYLNNDSEFFTIYNKTIKPGNQLFRKLKILKIRNEHVGHLLTDRTYATINWLLVEDLVEIARNVHDTINLEIFNSQNYWFLEQDTLNEIYSNDLQSRETFKLWRKLFIENIETVPRDELKHLTKINWPLQR